MADMDDFSREEILRRFSLEITRMNAQIEENEFKLFMMEKDKVRLQQSIDDAREEIVKKREEIKKHKDEWGMK